MCCLQTSELTKTIDKICESFQCKAVQGMLSHQLQHNRIDGEKTIIQNPTEKQRYVGCAFCFMHICVR